MKRRRLRQHIFQRGDECVSAAHRFHQSLGIVWNREAILPSGAFHVGSAPGVGSKGDCQEPSGHFAAQKFGLRVEDIAPVLRALFKDGGLVGHTRRARHLCNAEISVGGVERFCD